jgi:hypothetical protein
MPPSLDSFSKQGIFTSHGHKSLLVPELSGEEPAAAALSLRQQHPLAGWQGVLLPDLRCGCAACVEEKEREESQGVETELLCPTAECKQRQRSSWNAR